MKDKKIIYINISPLIIHIPDKGCIFKIEYKGPEIYYGNRIFFDENGDIEYKEEAAMTRSELRHLKADLLSIDESLELLSNMENDLIYVNDDNEFISREQYYEMETGKENYHEVAYILK